MNYGYQNSEDVQSLSSGKFGLNTGLLTKFEYNPNAGSNGEAADALDITVDIEGKEYMSRLFPVTKAYSKEGGELTDTTAKEYQESLDKQASLLNASVTDIMRCFLPDDAIKNAFAAGGLTSFKAYAQLVERLIKSNPNWNKTPIDIFLQYQYKPSEGKTITYLTLPPASSIKHGSFIVKHVAGTFTEERTDSHIKYVNSKGEYHPFKRGSWFTKSPFANQIKLEETKSDMDNNSSATGAGW